MIKRTVTLVGLLLALSAPAALADSGTPTPAPSTAAPSPVDAGHRLDQLHDRIQKAIARFRDRCEDGKAKPDRCKAAAEKAVDRLQKISGRIDDRVAKIKARCSGGTSTQPVPKRCAHADEIVEKLRSVQSDVQELARRLQAYLNSGPTSTTDGGSTTSSSGSGDSTGLESLGQLAADLAAAQAAAGN
jgi:ElaB/YqjD/DUF883 family membrane-anchored ribosome-binding protein